MNKLSRAQLDLVAQHIQQVKPHQALQAELVDHMASLIEQRMDQGQDFPAAFDQLTQQADAQALDQLKHLYSRAFTSHLATTVRGRVRSKRRPATKPFRYILLSSVLTFLILMSFLIVVSRPLAIPMGAFRTAGGVGLAGLLSVGVVRWWLTSRSLTSTSVALA